jgi:K+-sensing histidine kinase KdpD
MFICQLIIRKKERISVNSNLFDTIKIFYTIYSIRRKRSKNISLTLHDDSKNELIINYGTNIINLIVSILIDNAWKYSIINSTLKVYTTKTIDYLIDIVFENHSKPLTNDLNVFSKGTKGDKNSPGFGYGLFWAQILVDHYNRISGMEDNLLELVHNENIINDNEAIQEFHLNNIIIKGS